MQPETDKLPDDAVEARECITPTQAEGSEETSGSHSGQSLTKTDRLFEKKKPGYWIYETLVERNCWMCGGKFETRMELNKFCSPGCKERFMDESLRASRKV
jgi:hypothetical protein